MLTNELRPKIWEDAVGQRENIRLLKKILENPDTSPRNLIFEGSYGTGKTSFARIFGRLINNVPVKDFNIESDEFYFEHDISIIGKVKNIGTISDSINEGSRFGWIVNVLDEFHLSSEEAQSRLLKVLEGIESKTFCIFCTTEINRIIPTIRSRCLELQFGLASREDILQHLDRLEITNNIKISDSAKKSIAYRSKGHMRTVHMLLDKYKIVGEDAFLYFGKTGIELLTDFFRAAFENDKDQLLNKLRYIAEIPLEEMKLEFEEFIWICTHSYAGLQINEPAVIDLFVNHANKLEGLIKIYFSDLIDSMFRSERDFQSGMICIYQILQGIS